MKSTTDREIVLEREMADLGRERYWSKYHAAERNKRRSNSTVGRRLLRDGTRAVEKALKKWFAQYKRGKKCPNARSAEIASKLKPGVVAMLAVRVLLDSVGADNSFTSCAYSIGAAIDEEILYEKVKRAAPAAWRDFRRRHKTASKRSFKKMFRDLCAKASVDHVYSSRRERLRLGVVLIETVIQTSGLVQAHPMSMPSGKTRLVVVPAEDTLNWLSKANEAHESLYPFYLPTVEKPADWTDPWDGGYHTNLVVRRPLVKTRDRELVRDLETATMPTVYRAVNLLQATPWRINKTVLECLRWAWETGATVAGVPSKEDLARPKRPEGGFADEPARKLWARQAAMRHQEIVANRSRRVMFSKILFMAERFAEEPRFYFPHQVDFRGRLYPVPFFLNPQGSSVARGLLQFADGLPISDPEAIAWFEIHGANAFGFDKVSFDERRAWVRANEHLIKAVYTDPLDCKWWADADSPWEFLAWCLEYGAWLEDPRTPLHTPIAMDGSNNGLQIFSLLMRDEDGARATNCLPADAPHDIYQDVADVVTARLHADPDPLAARWLEFCGGRVPRKATKRAVMTLPYGSTFHSCTHYTRDWQRDHGRANGKENFWEQGYDPSVFLARHIWAAINQTITSARECMGWLREVARIHVEHGIPVRWTSPTGFPVKQAYMRFNTKEIKTAVGARVRYTQYREDTDEVALLKQMNGISPNLIHNYDAAAAAETVCSSADQGVTGFAMIHDSYGTHAAHTPIMARSLREVYASMFARPLLEQFRDECLSHLPAGVELPPVPEGGSLDVGVVRQSPYFFA